MFLIGFLSSQQRKNKFENEKGKENPSEVCNFVCLIKNLEITVVVTFP